MKLPIRTLGLAAAALLVGSALAPVSAQQQQSGVDGQVALRSDGALYLILNGQRRWIATVPASDEEINALPEGEPIMAGLALAGSAQASAGTASKPTGSSAQQPGSGSSSSAGPSSTPTPTPTPASNEDLSSDIPVQVDIEGESRIERGDSRKVTIKTKQGFTCELTLQLPDDDDVDEDSKNADSKGECRYTIEVPKDAKEGEGKLVGTVREGGKVNRHEVDIRIVKKK